MLTKSTVGASKKPFGLLSIYIEVFNLWSIAFVSFVEMGCFSLLYCLKCYQEKNNKIYIYIYNLENNI